MNKSALKKPAILVPQADSMGAIAVIRSLGQHGYVVHAASTKADALGCRSSFASFSHTSPAYQSADYLPWLRQLISRHEIQAIVPSEGFLLAIKLHFAEFSPLMDISQDKSIVYGCLSKVDVFDRFQKHDDTELKMHLPKTAIINSIDDLAGLDLNDWKLPFFIKGDAYYNRHSDDALVIKVSSLATLQDIASKALEQFEKILIQDNYSGRKVTVNLLLQNRQVLAESMVLGIHENPHTGGLTSLRQSWWQQAIYEDAVRRLRALNWEGAAMLEYKWVAQKQQFAFIELNARYWAALNLDILAGLHFPAIQFDYFFNKKIPATESRRQKKSITARHAFPADFGYLLSKLRDPSVNKRSKIKSTVGFFAYFFHPGISTDLNYPGDRKLVLLNTKTFLIDLIHSCIKKF